MHLSLHVHNIGLYVIIYIYFTLTMCISLARQAVLTVITALQAIIIIVIHISKLFVQNHMCILSFSVECHNSTASNPI